MKRDVMQAAGLEVFAEIAIVIFFAVFTLVALRVLFARRDAYEQLSQLPLDEGDEVTP